MQVIRAALTSALFFLMIPTASASPGVEGSRNLGLGNGGRASAYGVSGALINPSNLGFNQLFAVEPMYQLHLPSRTHGIGIAVVDSLNNSRISLGLGYLFLKGTPTITFPTVDMPERELELSRFGHEAFGAIGITVIKQWLGIGLKPKYQYASLRFRDDVGLARNATKRLSAFGLDTSVTLNIAGWVALAAIANNVTGNTPPPYTDERDIDGLDTVGIVEGSEINYDKLPELSEYALTFEHGLSVFPLHHPDFSLNFDGIYDFTTYSFEDHTRVQLGGSAEYVLGPVPLRFGTLWDGRGKGDDDDRFYLSGGIAYVKPAKVGGVGIDAGFSFRQQVSGPNKDTFLGLNLGIRIHPDL
ncbi:MAG: hypothetical protein AAF721_24700 [Myxococcota bacterium]